MSAHRGNANRVIIQSEVGGRIFPIVVSAIRRKINTDPEADDIAVLNGNIYLVIHENTVSLVRR